MTGMNTSLSIFLQRYVCAYICVLKLCLFLHIDSTSLPQEQKIEKNGRKGSVLALIITVAVIFVLANAEKVYIILLQVVFHRSMTCTCTCL